MTAELSPWDDIRRLADEVELKIHLGSMDARDRWHALEPRLVALEQRIAHSGEHLGDAVMDEIAAVRTALHDLRNEVYASARGDYIEGW